MHFSSNVCRRSLRFVTLWVQCHRLPWQNDNNLHCSSWVPCFSLLRVIGSCLGSVKNEDQLENEDLLVKSTIKDVLARSRSSWMGGRGCLANKDPLDQKTWKLRPPEIVAKSPLYIYPSKKLNTSIFYRFDLILTKVSPLEKELLVYSIIKLANQCALLESHVCICKPHYKSTGVMNGNWHLY